jgi:hypothetical protein
VLEAHFPTVGIGRAEHRAALNRGIDLFAELLVGLGDLIQAGPIEEDLEAAVIAMGGLLRLQLDCAGQIDEIEHILLVLEHGSGETRGRGGAPGGLHARNLAAIRAEAAEAEALIGVIGERQETLLLQVLQMRRRPADIVESAEVSRDSAASLRRLQDVVEARRAAALEFADLIGADRAC